MITIIKCLKLVLSDILRHWLVQLKIEIRKIANHLRGTFIHQTVNWLSTKSINDSDAIAKADRHFPPTLKWCMFIYRQTKMKNQADLLIIDETKPKLKNHHFQFRLELSSKTFHIFTKRLSVVVTKVFLPRLRSKTWMKFSV